MPRPPVVVKQRVGPIWQEMNWALAKKALKSKKDILIPTEDPKYALMKKEGIIVYDVVPLFVTKVSQS